MVFDGAFKFNETCLNENLLKGLDLLNNLFSVLLKFQSGRYALTTDIKQMFHQVKIIPSHRDALKFLWREKINERMHEFVMKVHSFGKTDCPCCANWPLTRPRETFFSRNYKSHHGKMLHGRLLKFFQRCKQKNIYR